jgi:hypothetical protein
MGNFQLVGHLVLAGKLRSWFVKKFVGKDKLVDA